MKDFQTQRHINHFGFLYSGYREVQGRNLSECHLEELSLFTKRDPFFATGGHEFVCPPSFYHVKNWDKNDIVPVTVDHLFWRTWFQAVCYTIGPKLVQPAKGFIPCTSLSYVFLARSMAPASQRCIIDVFKAPE